MSRLTKVMDQEDRIRNGDDPSVIDSVERKAKDSLKRGRNRAKNGPSDNRSRKRNDRNKGRKPVKNKRNTNKWRDSGKRQSYSVYGTDSGNSGADRKKLIIAGAVIALILGVIYVPQLFMKEKDDNPLTVKLDSSAVSINRNTLKRLPSADFDNDGINNSDEEKAGSNPYFVDSDRDHINDYCEMYVTKTDPAKYDDGYLVSAQKKIDSSGNKTLGSPYKIGNVILWPDDYTSRSYGSVIETLKGYRFTDFTGYAQFPETDSGYHFYQYADGVRTPLAYRKEEKVYRITQDSDHECTVEKYKNKLTQKADIAIAGHNFYFSKNTATDILTDLLPERGFITGRLKTTLDIDPDTSDGVTADIAVPDYDKKSDARFTLNTNTLNDYQYLRSMIKKNVCVAISLYIEDQGEYIGIAYGYQNDGSILIADPKTKDYIGTLKIKEKAVKMMNNDGKIVSFSYFDFKGMGFDSTRGDRICMFASTESNSLISEPSDTDTDSSTTTEATDDSGNTSTDAETGETSSDSSSSDTSDDTATDNRSSDKSGNSSSDTSESSSQNSSASENTDSTDSTEA